MKNYKYFWNFAKYLKTTTSRPTACPFSLVSNLTLSTFGTSPRGHGGRCQERFRTNLQPWSRSGLASCFSTGGTPGPAGLASLEHPKVADISVHQRVRDPRKFTSKSWLNLRSKYVMGSVKAETGVRQWLARPCGFAQGKLGLRTLAAVW